MNLNNLKKIKFVFQILLGFLFICFIIFITLTSFKTSKNKNFVFNFLPTPTPIAVPMHFTQSSFNNAVSEGSQSIIPSFTFNFNNSIPQSQQDQVKATLNPAVDLNYNWTNNNSTLIVSPNTPLQTNQNYQIKLNYPNGSYTSNFTSPSTISNQDQFILQGMDDTNFAKNQQDISSKYPFLNKLPYKPNQYNIYFDVNKKEFFIDLYIPSNYSSQQTTNLKNQALNDLKSVVANYLSYGNLVFETFNQ